MTDHSNEPLPSDEGRQARVQAFFADAKDEGPDLDEVLFDARADAVASISAPHAVWLVRLSGSAVTNGWIDPELQKNVVVPLGQEVEAAAGDAAPDAKVGLVGIGSGSVVLRYSPRRPSTPASDDQLAYDVSATDAAIEKVSRLHDMLEQNVPYAEIASAFRHDKDLLTRARTLMQGLNAMEVDLTTRWWNSEGQHHRARLTSIGRHYAAALFEGETTSEEIRLSGPVVAMDLSRGFAMGKPSRGRWDIQADPAVVQSGVLELGKSVHVWVIREHTIDHAGVKSSERLLFSRFSEQPQELPEPPSIS